LAASRRTSRAGATTRALVWFHRWLGIATCVVFALWFASGAVLLFKPFPSLDRTGRMALAAPLDTDAVAVSPRQALAGLNGATSLRLVERAGAPSYVADTANGAVAVDARSGATLPLLDEAQVRAIGARLAGRTPPAFTGPFGYDQWVVHNQFDALRPFYRLDLGDAAGSRLYVSARSGEIVQRTTASDRGWNWVGAVLHWAYFTPLRSSFTAWDQTVWWVSFVAMLVAIAGTALGLIRTVAVRRAGKPGLTYFRLKWLRWHHLLGLFAGVFVLTWILSGWLSMDHGRLFSRGQATQSQVADYAGLPLADAVSRVEPAAVRALTDARDIGFTAIAGTPLMIATGPNARTSFHNADGRAMEDAQRDRLIQGGIAAAWPGKAVPTGATVPPTDIYALAEGMPLSAQRYDRDGPAPLSVYVDQANGRILTVMNRSRAAYAWIYYALHTFNFPGLTTRPLLRYVVVLIPLLAGFLFSLTGIVIGYQRLRKSV
jgi:uncharacterized iron-regulated membrane protein